MYHWAHVIFAWDNVNIEHIARHRVSPAEAEAVVRGATRPFPQVIEGDKLVVWGSTGMGRYLQVIFVMKLPIETDYESLSVEDWMRVEAGEESRVIRVIHAMDLPEDKKRQLRRRRR